MAEREGPAPAHAVARGEDGFPGEVRNRSDLEAADVTVAEKLPAVAQVGGEAVISPATRRVFEAEV